MVSSAGLALPGMILQFTCRLLFRQISLFWSQGRRHFLLQRFSSFPRQALKPYIPMNRPDFGLRVRAAIESRPSKLYSIPGGGVSCADINLHEQNWIGIEGPQYPLKAAGGGLAPVDGALVLYMAARICNSPLNSLGWQVCSEDIQRAVSRGVAQNSKVAHCWLSHVWFCLQLVYPAQMKEHSIICVVMSLGTGNAFRFQDCTPFPHLCRIAKPMPCADIVYPTTNTIPASGCQYTSPSMTCLSAQAEWGWDVSRHCYELPTGSGSLETSPLAKINIFRL